MNRDRQAVAARMVAACNDDDMWADEMAAEAIAIRDEAVARELALVDAQFIAEVVLSNLCDGDRGGVLTMGAGDLADAVAESVVWAIREGIYKGKAE